MAYIRSIKGIYDGAKTWVRTIGRATKHFTILMGLHQGSTIYSVFICLGDEYIDVENSK